MDPAALPEYCLFWFQSMCMPRTDWASWTQAGGSILAILATGFFVWWQNRLQVQAQRHRDNRAERDELNSTVGLLKIARDKLEIACNHLGQANTMEQYLKDIYPMHMMWATRDALDLIDSKSVPESLHILMLIQAKAAASLAFKDLEGLSNASTHERALKRESVQLNAMGAIACIDPLLTELRKRIDMLD